MVRLSFITISAPFAMTATGIQSQGGQTPRESQNDQTAAGRRGRGKPHRLNDEKHGNRRHQHNPEYLYSTSHSRSQTFA